MDADGKLWFLDINFRNSTWSLTSMKAGMPLPINLDGSVEKVGVVPDPKRVGPASCNLEYG